MPDFELDDELFQPVGESEVTLNPLEGHGRHFTFKFRESSSLGFELVGYMVYVAAAGQEGEW